MRIKLFVPFILFLFVASFCLAAANPADKEYTSLVAKLKQGDQTVDLGKFRLAYAKTSFYDPYNENTANRNKMITAFNDKDYKIALDYANKILSKNYADIDAHFVSTTTYKNLGQPDKEALHDFMARGLIRSILESGDGKSPDTAYVVISVAEEYVILAILGLKTEMQSLIKDNGHNFDKMDVVNGQTGEKKTIYFNVDLPLGFLNRTMGQ